MKTGGEECLTDARSRTWGVQDDRRSDFIAELTRRVVRQHELAERHARVFRQYGASRTRCPPADAPAR